jgi:tRNA (adenine9-N1/guanine9-N1)-methyltransferase
VVASPLSPAEGGALVTPLWRPLFRALADAGIDSICLPRRFRCGLELPQCVTVWLLTGRYKLCQREGRGRALGEWGGVVLAAGGGPAACKWTLARECESQPAVRFEPPSRPRFIIDLSLWHEHTPGEKRELVEQILASLKAVRCVLWDGALWLTHAPAEFMEYLNRHAPGLAHRMNITSGMPRLEAPVVLDPEGDCVFSEEVARSHAEFIVGGIVDKERPLKSATRRLAEMMGVNKRCRIELRGRIIGVPDRINKIVEIVLKTLTGMPLEAAILSAQAKRDRVYRLMWEIVRRARRGRGSALVISRAALEEANWLGAPREEVELALRKARVTVID